MSAAVKVEVGQTWESTTRHGPQPIWRVKVQEVGANGALLAEIVSTNFADGSRTAPGTVVKSSVKTLNKFGRLVTP